MQGDDVNHAVADAEPDRAAALPFAVQRFLHAVEIKLFPVVDDGGELRVVSEGGHVGVVGDCHFAAFLRGLHGGGRIGVVGDDIGALREESVGGFAFFAGVVPGVNPYHADLRFGIDGLRAEHEGVDAAHDFGNRERADITDDVVLRHCPGYHSAEVSAFVKARQVVADIGGGFVAGGVFKHAVFVAARGFEGRLHIAEGGGED